MPKSNLNDHLHTISKITYRILGTTFLRVFLNIHLITFRAFRYTFINCWSLERYIIISIHRLKSVEPHWEPLISHHFDILSMTLHRLLVSLSWPHLKRLSEHYKLLRGSFINPSPLPQCHGICAPPAIREPLR